MRDRRSRTPARRAADASSPDRTSPRSRNTRGAAPRCGRSSARATGPGRRVRRPRPALRRAQRWTRVAASAQVERVGVGVGEGQRVGPGPGVTAQDVGERPPAGRHAGNLIRDGEFARGNRTGKTNRAPLAPDSLTARIACLYCLPDCLAYCFAVLHPPGVQYGFRSCPLPEPCLQTLAYKRFLLLTGTALHWLCTCSREERCMWGCVLAPALPSMACNPTCTSRPPE